MSKLKRKDFSPGTRVISSEYDKVMEAYRGTIGNLFTSNDPTLSTTGDVEKLTTSGYWGDVIKSCKIYQSDGSIRRLIDETVACANTKIMFQVENDEKVKQILDEWASRVNENVPNVLPGIHSIVEWILLSMLKTGMAVPDFEWGEMEIDGTTYQLPVKMTVHPTLSVKLKSNPIMFGYEEIWLTIQASYENSVRERAASDENYKIGYCEMATYRENGKPVRVMSDVWHDQRKNKEDTLCVFKPNAFALKYKWSPQEPTYYPIPPLKPLFGPIAMKHKLQEADMSLLQRVVHRIIHVKVGDKDSPAMPDILDKNGNVVEEGSLTSHSKMWQEGEGTQILTTDHTVEIKDLLPDLNLVLNQEKYLPCLQEIMGSFGIMQDPSTRLGSTPHTQSNLTKYERYLQDLQKSVILYLKWLTKQITEKNALKTKIQATMKAPYLDPSTQKSLSDLYNMGAIDIYTLLESFDLNAEQIKERKIRQLSDNNNEGENYWLPTASLVQIAKTDASTKKEALGKDSLPGRPQNKDKKEKTAKNLEVVKK